MNRLIQVVALLLFLYLFYIARKLDKGIDKDNDAFRDITDKLKGLANGDSGA